MKVTLTFNKGMQGWQSEHNGKLVVPDNRSGINTALLDAAITKGWESTSTLKVYLTPLMGFLTASHIPQNSHLPQ